MIVPVPTRSTASAVTVSMQSLITKADFKFVVRRQMSTLIMDDGIIGWQLVTVILYDQRVWR